MVVVWSALDMKNSYELIEIKNKIFLNYLKSTSKDAKEELEDYYKSIQEIEIKKIKRFKQKYTANNMLYANILNSSESYLNSSRYKFFDLCNGFNNSINCNSYSAALSVGRFIIEHYAMLVYAGNKIDNLIKNKNFYGLFSFINSMTAPPNQKNLLKDYKRVHVNDALRSIGEIWFSKGKSKKQRENAQKKMLQVYGDISEYVHPAAPSSLMYETQQIEEKDATNPLDKEFIHRTSFSPNSENMHKIIFLYFKVIINFAKSIVDALNSFEDNIIQKIKDHEKMIIKNFDINDFSKILGGK